LVWIALLFSIKKLEIFELLKRQISRELHKDSVLKPEDPGKVTSGHLSSREAVTSVHVSSGEVAASGHVDSVKAVTTGKVLTSGVSDSTKVVTSASLTSDGGEAVTLNEASAITNILGPFRE